MLELLNQMDGFSSQLDIKVIREDKFFPNCKRFFAIVPFVYLRLSLQRIVLIFLIQLYWDQVKQAITFLTATCHLSLIVQNTTFKLIFRYFSMSTSSHQFARKVDEWRWKVFAIEISLSTIPLKLCVSSHACSNLSKHNAVFFLVSRA